MTKHVSMIVLVGALWAATAPAQARWYTAHLGAETCVPLDDIDLSAPSWRVYYGTGPFHTPQDFVATLRRAGMRVVKSDASDDHMQLYDEPATHIGWAFFDNTDDCTTFAKLMEQAR